MSYEKLSIKETVQKIGNNEIYLPAIQRKFVWRQDQIEKLFDSIMRGYPIGTFLFWFIHRPNIDSYVFYKFLTDYHQRDKYLNDKAPNPELKDEIIGVLDGQQRLSSMYIALQGTYAVKKPYYSWNNDNAFPKTRLYLNLLSEESEEEDQEINYTFKFLTLEDSKIISKKQLWLDIRDVLNWEKDPPIDDYYDSLLENEKYQEIIYELQDKEIRKKIKSTIRVLHQRLVNDELINYFKIQQQELDDILKIFVRVNSGGTILSKTDLLFSTIVANWENGRDEIENFIESINSKGEGFWFNNDFIMRSCLVLTDCPVIFKVNSFKTENVLKIKEEWSNIKQAIEKTIELLIDYGISGYNLSSQNAIIPIAYYIIKGGSLDSKCKEDLRLYLIHSLLKNIFGGQGDSVLTNLRNNLRIHDKENKTYYLKKNTFEFDSIIETKLPSNKTLKISDDDIEEFLGYKKGNITYLILTLLYPHLKYGQVNFHQDHIHPSSLFTDSKLAKYQVPEDKYQKWQELKDKLPNLQLMEGRENESKNKTPFKDWLTGHDSTGSANVRNIDNFKTVNFIPLDNGLDLREFESFYDKRRELLKSELTKKLKSPAANTRP